MGKKCFVLTCVTISVIPAANEVLDPLHIQHFTIYCINRSIANNIPLLSFIDALYLKYQIGSIQKIHVNKSNWLCARI